MSAKKILDPGWGWDDTFGFSQAVQAGDFLFIAGQVALDSDGNIVGKGDMKAQTKQVFENTKAILDSAGATFDDIVDLTLFVVDVSRIKEIREARSEYIKQDPPSMTAVGVTRLIMPELLLEMKCTVLLKRS